MSTGYQIQGTLFNENDRKYKCCCGCCHSRTGTLVIGILLALTLGGSFYRTAETFLVLSEADRVTWYSVVLVVVSGVFFVWCVIGVLCLFVAVCREKSKLLIPQMALQVFYVIWVLVLAAGCMLAAILAQADDGIILRVQEMLTLREQRKNPKIQYDEIVGMTKELDNTTRNLFSIALWLMAAVFILTALFEIWFLLVLKSCYIYIKDKQAWAATHGVGNALGPVQYTQVPTAAGHEYGFPAQGQASAPPAYHMQMYGGGETQPLAGPPAYGETEQKKLYPAVDSMKI